jgi:hypothetical protein
MFFWAIILLVIAGVAVAAWRYDRKHKVAIINGPGSSVDARGDETLMHDKGNGYDSFGVGGH